LWTTLYIGNKITLKTAQLIVFRIQFQHCGRTDISGRLFVGRDWQLVVAYTSANPEEKAEAGRHGYVVSPHQNDMEYGTRHVG